MFHNEEPDDHLYNYLQNGVTQKLNKQKVTNKRLDCALGFALIDSSDYI